MRNLFITEKTNRKFGAFLLLQFSGTGIKKKRIIIKPISNSPRSESEKVLCITRVQIYYYIVDGVKNEKLNKNKKI